MGGDDPRVAGQNGRDLALPATGAVAGPAVGRSSGEHMVGVLGELPQMMLSNQKLAAPSNVGDRPPYLRATGNRTKRATALG